MKVITLGNIALNYDFRPEENTIIISDLEGSNAFAKDMGYQVGDRMISINGKI